jgi:hypothetical protein
MRFVFLATLLAPVLAVAAPLPGSDHSPPVLLDVASPYAMVNKSNTDSGWRLKMGFQVFGATSKTDRIRIELRQGKKVAATGTCGGTYYEDAKAFDVGCEIDPAGKGIQPIGAVEVDIIYTDDQTDKDYFVNTLKMNVKKMKGIGTFVDWAIIPDDILALGYVRQSHDPNESDDVTFEFWSTHYPGSKAATFRCTVDGKKIPDIEPSVGDSDYGGENTISHQSTTDKATKEWKFHRIGARLKAVKSGPKGKSPADQILYLVDHKGAWDCTLRIEGKPFRTFTFSVSDKGRVEPSAMQSGKWSLTMATNVVMVDMRIPKDNGYEARIRQDALKKSVGWGLPWPDHPKAKEAQAAFPPSMGTPD